MHGEYWGRDAVPEEHAYERLLQVLDAAHDRHRRHEQPGWLQPHPRSALAADDQALDPWAVSHTALQALVAANDHLLTLGHLLKGVNVLPAYGAFTLLRAAIEGACVALWAVGPDEPQQRRENVLRWERQNKRDMARFYGHLSGDQQEERKGFEASVYNLEKRALELGVPPRTLAKDLTSTMMLKASHVPDTGLTAWAAWSAASAFAHSRVWQIHLFQRTEWLSDRGVGGSRLKVTADTRLVTWLALTAEQLIKRAENLAIRRGRPPEPSRGALRIAFSQGIIRPPREDS